MLEQKRPQHHRRCLHLRDLKITILNLQQSLCIERDAESGVATSRKWTRRQQTIQVRKRSWLKSKEGGENASRMTYVLAANPDASY